MYDPDVTTFATDEPEIVPCSADEKIATDKFTLVHPTETWKKTELENYNVRELQVPIFKDGELVYEEPTLQEKQDYCHDEFASLYPEVTRINMPHEYYVDLTDKLRNLKNELIEKVDNLKKSLDENEKIEAVVKKFEDFFKTGLHFKCISVNITDGTSLRCAGTQRHKSKRR